MTESIIKCPICGEYLEKENRQMFCSNKHSFDIAKQGYVNLLISNKQKDLHHGDSAEMLQARKDILHNGYYSVIADELVKTISKKESGLNILDVGTGIGYYVKEVKNNVPLNTYYGLDISKKGVLEASKLDKEMNWIVGSGSKLPFMDESIDLIISVFSPIDEAEFSRVLKPSGTLLVVSPNENHLYELKEACYETVLPREYDKNELVTHFDKNESKNISKSEMFKKEHLKSLLMMTPHYWRTTLESKEKLYALDELKVNIDVVLNIYKKRPN